MKKVLMLLLTVAGILSCGKKEINIKAYYFPYTNFATSSTYKYVDASDSSKVVYWNFTSTIKNGDTLLFTTIYNKELMVTAAFVNQILEEGVELREMFVNTGDSNSLSKCEVRSSEVFNWKLKPKTSIFVSYAISNNTNTQTEEVVTERIFEPKKEIAKYAGKDYQCLVVREKTLINHIQETRTKTEEQERNCYFAPGIGLIQFETYNADATSNIFKLANIISDDEWKKMLSVPTDSTTTSIK